VMKNLSIRQNIIHYGGDNMIDYGLEPYNFDEQNYYDVSSMYVPVCSGMYINPYMPDYR